MDQLDLSGFFNTKTQAQDFSTRLSLVSEKIYENNFNLENSLLEQFGIKKRDGFITLLQNNKINTASGSDLKEFFTKIQQKVSTIPVLTLTIAIEPKETLLHEISEWCLLNTNQQVVFDITVDDSLIAGAIIYFSGKYLDFSIRDTFSQVLNNTLTNKTPLPAETTKDTTLPAEQQNTKTIPLG